MSTSTYAQLLWLVLLVSITICKIIKMLFCVLCLRWYKYVFVYFSVHLHNASVKT